MFLSVLVSSRYVDDGRKRTRGRSTSHLMWPVSSSPPPVDDNASLAVPAVRDPDQPSASYLITDQKRADGDEVPLGGSSDQASGSMLSSGRPRTSGDRHLQLPIQRRRRREDHAMYSTSGSGYVGSTSLEVDAAESFYTVSHSDDELERFLSAESTSDEPSDNIS